MSDSGLTPINWIDHQSNVDDMILLDDPQSMSNNCPYYDDRVFDYVQYLTDLDIVQESWTADKAFWPTIVTYGLTFVGGNLI